MFFRLEDLREALLKEIMAGDEAAVQELWQQYQSKEMFPRNDLLKALEEARVEAAERSLEEAQTSSSAAAEPELEALAAEDVPVVEEIKFSALAEYLTHCTEGVKVVKGPNSGSLYTTEDVTVTGALANVEGDYSSDSE